MYTSTIQYQKVHYIYIYIHANFEDILRNFGYIFSTPNNSIKFENARNQPYQLSEKERGFEIWKFLSLSS